MGASYVNISIEEMEEFLGPQGFRRIELPNTKEAVFGKRMDCDGQALSLRVYTGINPDGNSRDVGADAIRCNVFWRPIEGELRKIASSKRVHRVAGWRANLQERLDSIKCGPMCPDCGSPMATRKGKSGEFYGCGSYPNCRKTLPINS
jgi:hypothetical protein